VTLLFAAQLTLVHTISNSHGGQAAATDWILSATGPTSITGVAGDLSITSADVPAGTYKLAESGGAGGYDASPWTCVVNGAAGVAESAVTLAAGDVATCTIADSDRPSYVVVNAHSVGGPGRFVFTQATITTDANGVGTSRLEVSASAPLSVGQIAAPAGFSLTSSACQVDAGGAVFAHERVENGVTAVWRIAIAQPGTTIVCTFDDSLATHDDALAVRADWRYTDVCFGQPSGANDCPHGTSLGVALPMRGQSHEVIGVVANGAVREYKPGQVYARSSVAVSKDRPDVWIETDFGECTAGAAGKTLFALAPITPEGGADIIVVDVAPDGEAIELMRGTSPDVGWDDSSALVHVARAKADHTYAVYVRFGAGDKGAPLPAKSTCRITTSASSQGPGGPFITGDTTIVVTPVP
jgi:hypothetical protein